MNQQPKKPTKRPEFRKRPDYLIIIFTIIIVIAIIIFLRDALSGETADLTYNEIETAAVNNQIQHVEYELLGGDNLDLVVLRGQIYEEFADNSPFNGAAQFEIVIRIDDAEKILAEVADNGTTARIPLSGINIWTILIYLVPTIVIIGALFFIFRNANSQNNRAFDFAKNRAKLNREKTVTFKDVAGVEEEKQEMEELIDFLKTPKKYVDMGARIPKGVLLVGSPGTGKTLLARAVAGEANVPFFSISGSDFVEMFVGVGASRVRDLFKVAKENSPCILFIDEIDAVGRQRGAGLGGGHDEREQTLNQLLVEMDGFTSNMGIIIVAATNRPDVLDPALLRPGRFDRQITISLPDVRGREAILKVHARNKKIDASIKFDEFATKIPGFSGADIENLLNEAALLAARDNRTSILAKDLDEAIDRVMMGPAKKSRKYSVSEKKTVAYHEAGHAVIGLKLKGANVVRKVTIIPRGQAGGYNLMTPAEEKFLETKESLLARITSLLGGRVAEETVFDTVTTGAYNDFQQATQIARAMVTEYGMSDLGPVQYETRGNNVFLGRDYMKEKNFSDQVALEIDSEVRHIINTCYTNAKSIISEHRKLLDAISHYLVQVETLSQSDIEEINETGKLLWWEDKQQPKADVKLNPDAA